MGAGCHRQETSSFGRSRGHCPVGCHPNRAGRATQELTLSVCELVIGGNMSSQHCQWCQAVPHPALGWGLLLLGRVRSHLCLQGGTVEVCTDKTRAGKILRKAQDMLIIWSTDNAKHAFLASLWSPAVRCQSCETGRKHTGRTAQLHFCQPCLLILRHDITFLPSSASGYITTPHISATFSPIAMEAPFLVFYLHPFPQPIYTFRQLNHHPHQKHP